MTQDGRVDLDRPHVVISDIATGAPVRAQTWSDMARLAHWVAGRGTVLVPQHKTMIRFDAAGFFGVTSATLRYMTRPQGRAIARVWVFEFRGHTGFPGTVTIQPLEIPSAVSPPYTVEAPAYGTRMAPIVVVEGAGVEAELARSVSDQEITCEVVCTAGYVDLVSCAVWELPRAALTQDSTDLAIGLDGFFPRRPIQGGVDYQSIKGLFDLTIGLTQLSGTRPRTKSGHIGRWGPEMQSTSATAISLLESGFDYRILGGKDRPSDTTTTLTAYIYAYYGGGSGTPSGDWRVVTGSGGASAWQPITNTSYAWLGPLTFTVTAEDPTTSYGVASSYDTLRFEVRSNSFATVYVSGWAVLE
jgi:hypothetical protein